MSVMVLRRFAAGRIQGILLARDSQFLHLHRSYSTALIAVLGLLVADYPILEMECYL